MGVRTYGQMGLADPLRKMDKKIKKTKTCKKNSFFMFMLYFESNQGKEV